MMRPPAADADAMARTLNRLRVVAALAIFAIAIASRPTETNPGISVVAALLIAGGLVVNGLLPRLVGRGSVDTSTVAVVQITLDVLLVVLAMRAFSVPFDSLVNLALLVPIVEAAIRFRIRGAVLCWGAATGLFFLSVLGSDTVVTSEVASQAAATSAVLLFLSLPIAYTTERLMDDLRATARARFVAERRAEMLAVLALAGRELNALDRSSVLDAIVQSAMRFGAHAGDGRVWTGERWRTIDVPKTTPHRSNYLLLKAPPAPDDGWEDGVTITTEGEWAVVTLRQRARDHHLIVRLVTDQAWQQLIAEALEVIVALADVALDNTRLHDELAELTAELQHRAHHDELTGLANRRELTATLERLASTPNRRGVGVLLVDLDGFKAINDTLGHQAGDELLVRVARRLRNAAGPNALSVRLGGDELAVVVEDDDPELRTVEIALRFRDALESPVVLEGEAVTIGASIGTTIVEAGIELDPSDTLRQADEAMYRDKVKRKRTRTAPSTR